MRNIVGFHRQCVCPVPAEAEELVPFLYSDFSTVFRYEQLPEHGRQRKVGDREPKWGRDHRDPDADSKRRRHDGVSIRVSAVGSARHSLWRMVRAEEDFHHWGTSEVLIALRVLPCLPSLQLTQAGMRVILKIVVHLKGDITYHNANFAFFYRTHDPRDERRLVADSCVGRLRYCELVPENNMWIRFHRSLRRTH